MKGPSREVRELCGERDQARCVICGKPLYGVPASLHHRRMRSHPYDAMHKAANLIWVCGSGTTFCHGMIHANPALAYKMGWLVHSYETAVNVPIYTWHGWMMLGNNGSMVKVDVESTGDTGIVRS